MGSAISTCDENGVPYDLRNKESTLTFLATVMRRYDLDGALDAIFGADTESADSRREVSTLLTTFSTHLLESLAPVYWHDRDVQRVLDEADPRGPEGGKRRRQVGNSEPSVPSLTSLEQAIAERRDQFGFHLLLWPKCKWQPSTTAAALQTYKSLVMDQLNGAEMVTTRSMVESICREMDSWIGTRPNKEDIARTEVGVRRLYARYRGLMAPKGAAGAVATAVEKAFEDEHLDPRFRIAADNAAKLEVLAVAGGIHAAAAQGVAGSLALYRGMRPQGGSMPRTPQGRPSRADADKRRDSAPATRNDAPTVCWSCKKPGHPRRLCPERKSD